MPIEPDAFVLGRYSELVKSMEKLSLGKVWRDALKLRKAMKERNLEKTPGCSSIELDGVIHEFQKGDKSHPKIKEIHKLLDEIMSHLKNNECLTRTSVFS
ncbi:Pentatricopeptide repeat-containing protein, chloroplastic [Vitis vinifera]|uniref:Pentatricopeptide repeat-containing protein, chloroplastic n=1 Tax=Vitis vinifera TaxID=29760 RepID=A0A438D2W3_VITVI|nr:Pentatricopeptide repeat-containing protein, chloroplastic [Vitis vinifera]